MGKTITAFRELATTQLVEKVKESARMAPKIGNVLQELEKILEKKARGEVT